MDEGFSDDASLEKLKADWLLDVDVRVQSWDEVKHSSLSWLTQGFHSFKSVQLCWLGRAVEEHWPALSFM